MSGIRYLREINRRIDPGEEPRDVVVMIDIMANERAKANDIAVSDQDYEFAAVMICIIFDVVKPKAYIERVTAFRQSYRDISESDFLQVRFRESLTPALLHAPTAQQAIQLGFDALFITRGAARAFGVG